MKSLNNIKKITTRNSPKQLLKFLNLFDFIIKTSMDGDIYSVNININHKSYNFDNKEENKYKKSEISFNQQIFLKLN